eukprot:302896_1
MGSSLEKTAEISDHTQDITNFFISFVWLIIYIRSFHHHDAPIYKSTKVITTLYPAGYALKYFIDIFLVFIVKAHYPNNADAKWVDDVILDPIQRMCFTVTNTSFYVSMLLKLNYAFKDSIFALKQNILYLLSILLTMAFLLDITFFTTKKIVNEKLSTKIHSNIPFHLGWIRTIFLWVLGSVFIALFVDKLLKFVMLRSRSRRLESSSIALHTISSPSSRTMVIREEKMNLSYKQKKHLQIAVKFVLLHGIAITLMLIQFSGWTLLDFELIKDETSVLWFSIFWSWFWDVVLFINLYTIWLSFAFAKPHYNYVCKTCNQCCLNLCSSLVALKMADEITQSNQLKGECDAYQD